MSKMLKSFITYGLSILLLSATLHVDLYHHEHYDGYSICDIDCDDEGSRVDVPGISNTNCGYKNTPRRYHTAGLETRFYKDINLFGLDNNLKYGAKFEFEKIERKARITGSDKKQTGTQVTEDEYAKMSEDAEVYAFALYLEDDIHTNDKLILTPGLRYENLYLTVNKLLEKPNPEDTNSNLSILGRYYLNVKIFDYLYNLEPGHGGEIQLTDALSKMLSDHKFIVTESEGNHFDVGNLKGLELAEIYLNNHPL